MYSCLNSYLRLSLFLSSAPQSISWWSAVFLQSLKTDKHLVFFIYFTATVVSFTCSELKGVGQGGCNHQPIHGMGLKCGRGELLYHLYHLKARRMPQPHTWHSDLKCNEVKNVPCRCRWSSERSRSSIRSSSSSSEEPRLFKTSCREKNKTQKLKTNRMRR